MQEGIFTVRTLTEQLRKNLEGRFPFVWVRGEVSNLTCPSSGHIYFTLKDSEAQLQCVWFKGQQLQAGKSQSFDPLTGEVFDKPRPAPLELLRSGLSLLCAGRISVYPARGQYQLLVEMVQAAGEGVLAQAFEERKRALAQAGYFELARKRPLPYDPQRVALITSAGGAAIHDFMRLAQRRGSGSKIRLFPVLVQGDSAAPDIVRALTEVNRQAWAQVAVLIRGGGSLEDLWAFNEESLATAVFKSDIPVLAGIGHEVDVTLADMTADVRAATPSHAAQLLWPDRDELWQRLDEIQLTLQQLVSLRLERAEQILDSMDTALRWVSPLRHYDRMREKLMMLSRGLERNARQWLATKMHSLDKVEDARSRALTPEMLDMRAVKLDLLSTRSKTAIQTMLATQERILQGYATTLDACDPLAPLKRGYALVQKEGRLLHSVDQAIPGDRIDIRLADGHIFATVEGPVPHEGRGEEKA